MPSISPTKVLSACRITKSWKRPAKRGVFCLVHDLGFGELVAAKGTALPSVITFRLRNMHPDQVDAALQLIIPQHWEALEHGAILSVTEGRVRVRSLPIGT